MYKFIPCTRAYALVSFSSSLTLIFYIFSSFNYEILFVLLLCTNFASNFQAHRSNDVQNMANLVFKARKTIFILDLEKT